MATTQSGFQVILDYGDTRLISNPTVPGTDVEVLGGLLAGDTATVLLYVASRWNTDIEPLVQERGIWGFEPKKITGGDGSTWSNHAGGVAIDLMSADHPQGSQTMDGAGYGKARRIVDDVNGWAGETVIDWGGEWSGRSKDEMHFQLHADVNLFALNRAANHITNGGTPPTPTTGRNDDMPSADEIAKAILAAPIGYQTAVENPNGSGYVPKRVNAGEPGGNVAGLLESTATLGSRDFLDNHPAKDD